MCSRVCAYRYFEQLMLQLTRYFPFPLGFSWCKTKYISSKIKADRHQVPLLLLRTWYWWILSCHIVVVMSPSIKCHLPESDLYEMSYRYIVRWAWFFCSTTLILFYFIAIPLTLVEWSQSLGGLGRRRSQPSVCQIVQLKLEWPVCCIILWKHVWWLCKWSW